ADVSSSRPRPLPPRPSPLLPCPHRFWRTCGGSVRPGPRCHPAFVCRGGRGGPGTGFHVDGAPVGRTGHKSVAACAVHADLVISRMDGCFHRNSLTGCPVLAWFWLGRGSSWWQTFI